jgi:hypothetical protein
MTLATTRAENLLERIRGEYLALPGLRLTVAQARRMWTLEDRECADLLSALVESGFLRTTNDGRYARAFDGLAGLSRPRAAKAEFADSLAKLTRPAPPARRA